MARNKKIEVVIESLSKAVDELTRQQQEERRDSEKSQKGLQREIQILSRTIQESNQQKVNENKRSSENQKSFQKELEKIRNSIHKISFDTPTPNKQKQDEPAKIRKPDQIVENAKKSFFDTSNHKKADKIKSTGIGRLATELMLKNENKKVSESLMEAAKLKKDSLVTRMKRAVDPLNFVHKATFGNEFLTSAIGKGILGRSSKDINYYTKTLNEDYFNKPKSVSTGKGVLGSNVDNVESAEQHPYFKRTSIRASAPGIMRVDSDRDIFVKMYKVLSETHKENLEKQEKETTLENEKHAEYKSFKQKLQDNQDSKKEKSSSEEIKELTKQVVHLLPSVDTLKESIDNLAKVIESKDFGGGGGGDGFGLDDLVDGLGGDPKKKGKKGKGVKGKLAKVGGSMDMGKLAESAKKVPGKSAGGILGSMSKVGKFAAKGLKFIPGVGLIAAGADIYDRVGKGDYLGAAISGAAGVAGLIPGIGTAAALGLEGVNLTRDYVNENQRDMKLPGEAPGGPEKREIAQSENINKDVFKPPSGKGGGATGSAARAMEILMSKGWTKVQAAGIVASLKAESSFNTQAKGDGGKALGIAQWHPDRQRTFAQVVGKPVLESSFEEQVAFVDYELKHSEKRAGKALMMAQTPQEAAAIVEQKYERSALGLKGGVQPQRVKDAIAFAGGDVSAKGEGAPDFSAKSSGGAVPTLSEMANQKASSGSSIGSELGNIQQPTATKLDSALSGSSQSSAGANQTIGQQPSNTEEMVPFTPDFSGDIPGADLQQSFLELIPNVQSKIASILDSTTKQNEQLKLSSVQTPTTIQQSQQPTSSQGNQKQTTTSTISISVRNDEPIFEKISMQNWRKAMV